MRGTPDTTPGIRLGDYAFQKARSSRCNHLELLDTQRRDILRWLFVGGKKKEDRNDCGKAKRISHLSVVNYCGKAVYFTLLNFSELNPTWLNHITSFVTGQTT
jgi:hypothetical protein